MLLFTAFVINSGQYYCFFLTVHWSFSPAIIYLFSLMCPKVVEVISFLLSFRYQLSVSKFFSQSLCMQRKCQNSRYAVWGDLTKLLKCDRLVQGHLLQPVFNSGWRRSAHPRGMRDVPGSAPAPVAFPSPCPHWPQAFAATYLFLVLLEGSFIIGT